MFNRFILSLVSFVAGVASMGCIYHYKLSKLGITYSNELGVVIPLIVKVGLTVFLLLVVGVQVIMGNVEDEDL